MRGYSCIIIFSILLSACNYHVNKDGFATEDSSGASKVATDKKIDWDLMRTEVLNSCVSCHSGKQSPTLVSYSEVTANIQKVWSEVSSQAMPPPRAGLPPLSQCKTAILKKWIVLGQPQTSTETVAGLKECADMKPVVPIAQMPLNYQTLHDRILVPRCLNCHNPKDPSDAAAILFTPYSELMTRARMWSTPASSSKVVRLLRTTDLEERMPPPEAGAALAEEEIQFVERWIEAGRPEF